MLDAAIEAPSPIEPITTLFPHGTARWEKRYGCRWDVPLIEDSIESRLRQKSTQCSDAGCADHRAPSAGEVVISEPLQDQHFGDGIGFCAAQDCRKLQSKHARASQRLDRFRSERCRLFALAAGCFQDRRPISSTRASSKSRFACRSCGNCFVVSPLRGARRFRRLQIKLAHIHFLLVHLSLARLLWLLIIYEYNSIVNTAHKWVKSHNRMMTIDRRIDATGSLVAYDSDSELSRSMTAAQKVESRSDRRKRRNRQALIEAGYQIMAEKGIDAATMSEISELADVGAGTVYNYFASKDELAMCVMEQVMDRLSQRIEAVTNSFTDPAQVYAFGIRNVMKAATTDQRWRWLLRRSEVIADAMYRVMGPYAIRDIRNAVAAGRYRVEDPELAWRQATHAIVGFSLAVCDKNILP